MDRIIDFSQTVTIIQSRAVPDNSRPVGYAALIAALGLSAPAPHTLAAARADYKSVDAPGWAIYSPRHAPEPSLAGHLTFALKYEGVDLLVLKTLFRAVGAASIEAWVAAAPTSRYARRIWFLFEWLLGERLDLPDAKTGSYVDALDDTLQLGAKPRNSRRQRVRDNLPGTPAFCPLVYRTPEIEEMLALDLKQAAAAAIGAVPKDLIARAAAFLLLSDSRASYAIEGESPPQERIQRWGAAIGQAGARPISHAELRRLQDLVLGDTRFVHKGYRVEGGFVGSHDRDTRAPLPEHVSARPDDLSDLMEGLLCFDTEHVETMDAIAAAAVLAFGFVYIHPFEDGNGRVHRYLMHHVLARAGFNAPGVVFPISAAILSRIAEYRRVLESHSARMLPFVDWRATPSGNVEVGNETADLYRFFDATPQAAFLMSCVRQTIEVDLPQEVAFLKSYDRFKLGTQQVAEMPERTIDLLFHFLRQNDGRLSRRAREGEFSLLTPDEVGRLERIYGEAFAKA